MRSILAVLRKDVLVEFRNRESLSSMTMFGLLVVVIFNFAFEPSGAERIRIAPGILWVAFSFAGVIGLNRSLSIETDNDCLSGLLLAPMGRGELYVAKVLANFLFMLISEAVILPLFVLFYNLRFNLQFVEIAAIAALGTLGFASIGTILSTISANTRMKEVMLPVLQIPLTVPVIIGAVEATSMILSGETDGISAWIYLMAGFSIIYLVLSYLIFEYVVEE